MMKNQKSAPSLVVRPLLLVLLLCLLLSTRSTYALAAPVENNVLDGIIKLYRETAISWREPILSAANRLFWTLAGIDFVWMGLNLALHKADLGTIVAELIKRILLIGFYLALLTNSGLWSQAIIDSFRNLAGSANSSSGLPGGITPSNIFDIGLRIVGDLSDKVSFTEMGESLARVLVSLAILVSFALTAAYLLVALIEVYIAVNGAVILLGLGGSRWTSDYAVKYLVYVFSAGMKIFVMQLLIGIGQSFIQKMNTSYSGNLTHTLVLFGVSVVLVILVKTVPDYIQSILSGVSPGSAGGAVFSAATSLASSSMAGSLSGASSGLGSGMALTQAALLARANAQEGGVSSSVRSMAMGTAKNIGRSVLGDIGGRISGSVSQQYGTIGGRMASRMKEERLSKEPLKPKKDEGKKT